MEKTYAYTLWLLNYDATHPNAKIRYTASDMILYIHSDVSYLSEPRPCSRAGGHYFLGDKRLDMTTPPTNHPRLNVPIHTISRIMSNVMGSAAKAEIGAAYINVQETVPIRNLIRKLGHPQPAIPIQVNNSTADGFTNNKIKQKLSTCAFIGYATAQAKVSSSSTGSPASLTCATIAPSTIHCRTIS